MAKKTAKPPEPTSIDVHYDLGDLPSAQHKAGLAGLLLQIESMRERQEAGQLPADREIPLVVEQTATAATVRFTERSAQTLFDDLFAAETVEVRSKSKWSGAQEKRQEINANPQPGEPKRWFVYDTVQPKGHFLRKYTEGDKDVWHKLWRDMIYAVPRNKPMSKKTFERRADDQPAKEGGEVWKALLAQRRAQDKGTHATTELAGSLMLAVQAVTAEAIPFLDRVETQLLLHFWILTARVFVPQRVNADGESEFVGYALAIPEVSDLRKFCESYKKWLSKLDATRIQYRPAGAVIALPEQAPLEFLYNLDRLTAEKVLADRPARYMAGIEFFHMVVEGNNVKLKAHGRIPVEDNLLECYGAIRRDFHNTVLLAGLTLSLLRCRPWFAELDAPVHDRDWSHLIQSSQEHRRTPPAMIGFAPEVDRIFKNVVTSCKSVSTSEGDNMPQPDVSPEAVDVIVYDLVRVYVRERACGRAGVKTEDENWWMKTANERRDVCAKLFLEFRSRHGEEFVSYFADTIASVAQWLDEGRFLTLSRALMCVHAPGDGPDRPRNRDDIKTLTMLALAAHSRSSKPKDSASNSSTTASHLENAE